MFVLCVSCPFQRDDWVKDPRVGESIKLDTIPPLLKFDVFRGKTMYLIASLTPSQSAGRDPVAPLKVETGAHQDNFM